MPEGRYLLWILDSAFALETRESFSSAELSPEDSSGSELFNPTVLTLPDFEALAPSFILFYEYLLPLSFPEERAEIAERFSGYEVLYDDGISLSARYPSGAFESEESLDGLYLMEGSTIKERFPATWNYAPYDTVISEAAAAFLLGKDIASTVLSGTPGDRVPERFRTGEPSLFLHVPPDLADASPKGVRLETSGSDEGAFSERMTLDHPAAQQRFLIEKLTPVLADYGVKGIALVGTEDQSVLASLSELFPAWTFTPLSSTEDLLYWLSGEVLVVNAEGEVITPLTLVASTSKDTQALERALGQAQP